MYEECTTGILWVYQGCIRGVSDVSSPAHDDVEGFGVRRQRRRLSSGSVRATSVRPVAHAARGLPRRRRAQHLRIRLPQVVPHLQA